MFEHTKRQVKVFFFPEMRLYFLIFITAVCFLFPLRIRKVGVRPWAAIFFLFYGNTLNNRSKAATVYEREIYLGCTLPPKLSLNASPDCEFALNVE